VPQEYGWIELGGALLPRLDGTLNTSTLESSTSTDLELRFNPGFAVAGGFAERLTSTLVAEIQAGFFYHDIDELRFQTGTSWSPDASLLQVPVTFNLLFEIPLKSRLVPFAGAGVGATISWLDVDDSIPIQGATFVRVDRSSTEINFAYQLFAGARLRMGSQGTLALTYRAVANGSPRWSLKEKDSGNTVGNLKAEDVLVHALTLGFLVEF
jgi:opacity protein-like surface antigen